MISIRDFEALQNKSQSLIIRCKNSRVCHKFLNLITHSCSFFKQYLKSLAISIIFYIEYSVLLFYILSKARPTFAVCVCVCKLRKRGQVGGGGGGGGALSLMKICKNKMTKTMTFKCLPTNSHMRRPRLYGEKLSWVEGSTTYHSYTGCANFSYHFLTKRGEPFTYVKSLL